MRLRKLVIEIVRVMADLPLEKRRTPFIQLLTVLLQKDLTKKVLELRKKSVILGFPGILRVLNDNDVELLTRSVECFERLRARRHDKRN